MSSSILEEPADSLPGDPGEGSTGSVTELLKNVSALHSSQFKEFATTSESRQLVKKITRLWAKPTVKAVFNAVYGEHPPLEYVPATPLPTTPARAPPTITPPSPNTTSTPATSSSTPSVTFLAPAPGPDVSTPEVSTPGVSTPNVSTPAVSTSGVSTPAVTPLVPVTSLTQAASTLREAGTSSRRAATSSTRAGLPPTRAGPQTGAEHSTVPAELSATRAGLSATRATRSATRAGTSTAQAEPSSAPVTSTSTRPTPPIHRYRPRQRQEPIEGNPHQTVAAEEEQSESPNRRSQAAPQNFRKRGRVQERTVQEPPTGVSDPHVNSPAKRQRIVDTNASASANTPTSSQTTVAQSALDQIELELIRFPDGVRGTEMDNFTLNITLYEEFNNPEQMLNAVTLLSRISSGNVTTDVDVTTIPSTLALTGNNLLPSLLAVSRQANDYLQDLDMNIQATRMKTIMSYIILYLTLEHAVVPKIKEQHPEKFPRWINGVKYERFAKMLKESNPECKADGSKLRTDSNYGKCFWEYGQALGIASLLLFAVSGIGITRIGRVTRGGIPALAASLTTSGTWWAFAHAIGPAAFRTLFGPRDIVYTTPQLLNRIRSEPLAVPIGRISTISSSELPRHGSEFPEVENWQIVIGTDTLAVQRHPTGILEPDRVLKRNLGVWLDNTSGDDIVVDADGNKTPFHAFKTLLPPNNISKHLVNYLTKVYNSRAIPGRLAMPYEALTAFSGNFQQFLQSLGPVTEDGNQIERLVCPFDLETGTIGIIIYPNTSQAVAYNWTDEARLGDGILKQLRDSFTDVHWMSGIAPIMPAEIVTSKRDSTLRYLEFVRHEITGSRGLAKPRELGMVTTIDNVLEAVAVEAYLEVLSDAWRVVPSRFFRVVDSEATGVVDSEVAGMVDPEVAGVVRGELVAAAGSAPE